MFWTAILVTTARVCGEIISPAFGSGIFQDRFLDEIYSANISLMATIYKFDNDDIFDAFMDIGKRGVEMKIVCDDTAYDMCSKLDNFGLITRFNMKGYDKLHAKSILIDGKKLIIGSFNLDEHVFSTNMEIGLITTSSTDINKYIDFVSQIQYSNGIY